MSYPTDLTDGQWNIVKDLFKRKTKRGAPRGWSEREIVNAIIYLVKTGVQWNMLPQDFPPKSTVFYYFQKWNYDGTWEKAMYLLNRLTRVKAGRDPEPTLGIIDSKSVQAANKCEEKGIDGGKKNQRQKTAYCDRYSWMHAARQSSQSE